MKEYKKVDQQSLRMRIIVFSFGTILCVVFPLIRLFNGASLIRAEEGLVYIVIDVAPLVALPVFIVLLIIAIMEKRKHSGK